MSCTFAFLCVATLPFVLSIQVHQHMTQDEVLQTFQTSHDAVPDYEVVPVFHKLRKRDAGNSSTAVKVNAFNRKISLYLQPTDGILAGMHTPVWTVVRDPAWPERTKYQRVPNPFKDIGQTYQDRSKLAAIVAYEGKGGETLITGNLLSDLIVRPLPHRLHETVLRQTRSLDDSLLNADMADEGFRRSEHLHVVFKRHEPLKNSMHDGIKIVQRDARKSGDNSNERSKRSIPDIIYPEILVILDYNLYRVLGKNVKDATRYVLAFWNAVDLRYRLLEEPRIRLNIAGIIISKEPGGTPYLEDYKRGSTEVDADLAITAMSHYFYRESYRFPFSMYDMAVAMTQLDMCNVEYNGVCNPSTLGYAYEWGTCNRSHVDMNTEAVGIVEDNGGYSAIIPAAHEVAHLMGAPHDGLTNPFDCPPWEGYIMSTMLNFRENSFQWSNCSLKSFHEFFSYPDASCVFNKPRPDEPVPLMLPGKLLTLDEQCEKVHGTRACKHNASVCISLECYVPQMGGECRTVSAAAEGSFCGNGMHCINGHCISEESTFVPYTLSTTLAPLLPNFNGPNFFFPSQTNHTDSEGNPNEISTTE